MDYRKYWEILVYTAAAIIGRLLLQWIPGASPIIPFALYTAGKFGLEAAVTVGVVAVLVSSALISANYSSNIFDNFALIQTVLAVGLVVTGMAIAVHILKTKNLVYRVITATMLVEIGISLLQGEIFRIPESVYHLGANILFAGAIMALTAKKEKAEEKPVQEEGHYEDYSEEHSEHDHDDHGH